MLQYYVNLEPATSGAAIWNLVSKLILNGWTKISDSDGTTYSAGGTQITGGNSGANGFNNDNAWVKLRSPAGGGGAEFTIQRMNATDFRIKHSVSAGFSGGSPSASQTPSATDEFILLGGGSDGTPSGAALFPLIAYVQHIVIETSAKYPFIMFGYTKTSPDDHFILMYDQVTGVAQDNDQFTYYAGMTNSKLVESNLNNENTASPISWMKYGMVGAAVLHTPALTFRSSGGSFAPLNCPQNAHNSNDDQFPIIYGRRAALAAPNGFKGISGFLRWPGVSRQTGSTLGSKNRIIVGHLSLPWDGSSTPTI